MVKKLLLEPVSVSQTTSMDLVGVRAAGDAVSNKDELKQLFANEIQELVTRELAVREKILQDKYEKELHLRLQKREREEAALAQKLNQQLSVVASILESIEEERRKILESSVKELDPILVQMCLEALYKICAEKDVFEKIVIKSIDAILTTYLANAQVKLVVSEEVFNILVNSSRETALSGNLSLDKSLKIGQIRVDDGTCITEAGLVEQLDNLRDALLAELRKNYAL
jgi:hypothetical protein